MQWKDIPDQPYQICEEGHVRNRYGYIKKPWIDAGGYANLTLEGQKRRRARVHVLVAEAFLGARPPGCDIDHINRDRTDNRAANLRYATRSRNNLNGAQQRSNSSGYVGVRFFKKPNLKKPWTARIKIDGVEHNLGYFATPEAAYQARLAKQRQLET